MKKTEMRNEKTMCLDKMSALEIVRAMNEEDKTVAYAVEKALPQIAKAVAEESFVDGTKCNLILKSWRYSMEKTDKNVELLAKTTVSKLSQL